MIAYIKLAVAPLTWETTGKIRALHPGEAVVYSAGEKSRPYPRKVSLVITQTKANHEKITTLLESLRSPNASAKSHLGEE